jgi:hypothetical protein
MPLPPASQLRPRLHLPLLSLVVSELEGEYATDLTNLSAAAFDEDEVGACAPHTPHPTHIVTRSGSALHTCNSAHALSLQRSLCVCTDSRAPKAAPLTARLTARLHG